jgi:hypothetical protein
VSACAQSPPAGGGTAGPAAGGADAWLRRQLEVASGREFYLLLDPAASALRLMLQGVVLREYRVLGVETGTARVLFYQRAVPAEWSERIWTGGRLEPEPRRERVEIRPPTEGAAANAEEPPIPPTPEELLSAPPRYFVRFEGGLALEVLEAGVRSSAGYLADLWESLEPRGGDAIRLRVTLGAEDAASLYRSLPPDTKFLLAHQQGGGQPGG